MRQRDQNQPEGVSFGKPYNIESGTGTYVLILHAEHERTIRIGRLGYLQVVPGFYLYVGSAFGPGGLAARVAHHRKPSHRPHWHIDYLRPFLHVCDVWYCYHPVRREHTWAATINGLADLSVPLRGFGSSDCSCEAHLFYTSLTPKFRAFTILIRNEVEAHEPIYHFS